MRAVDFPSQKELDKCATENWWKSAKVVQVKIDGKVWNSLDTFDLSGVKGYQGVVPLAVNEAASRRCWSVLLLSTGIPAGDQVGRFRPFQPRSSLGLSFRGVEKESRDDYLEEASSDRTAMRFVALTDHLLDHVGNAAAPSR